MRPDFDDPDALVPQKLDAQESRAYEERTADALREHLIASAAGPVIVDGVVYVNSGYPRFGGAIGNVLLAFSADDAAAK